MYKRINLEQRTPEWIAYRRKKIGASEAATIMGLNPHESARELFDKKLWGDKKSDNPAMRKGRELEHEAINAFRSTLFKHIELEQPTLESTINPWMSASLDGFNEEYRVVVESKSGKKAHKLTMENGVPDYYYPQLQHILFVTGFDKITYWSYYPDNFETPSIAIEVDRDEAFIERMIEAEGKFYNCMLTLTPPECHK